jgi:hypothetical protein
MEYEFSFKTFKMIPSIRVKMYYFEIFSPFLAQVQPQLCVRNVLSIACSCSRFWMYVALRHSCSMLCEGLPQAMFHGSKVEEFFFGLQNISVQ